MCFYCAAGDGGYMVCPLLWFLSTSVIFANPLEKGLFLLFHRVTVLF